METHAFSLVMSPNQKFWCRDGLLPGWAVGQRVLAWETLPTGLPVILVVNNTASGGGRVDCAMPDGSAFWILYDEGYRRLVHQADGYTIHVALHGAAATKHAAI